MINVVTVKEGDKYSAEYVNRIKIMVGRNLNEQHKIYCYTDDSNGIDSSIECIPIEEKYALEHWWNKMAIFADWMPYNGRCLYLDLDTVIQNNIDDLVHHEPSGLCGIWTYWHEVWTYGDYPHPMYRWKVPFNSSVMTWNTNECHYIWNEFWKNHNEYIMKYHGDDKFIGNEIEYKTFPKKWIYSRIYGADTNIDWNDDVIYNKHRHLCCYEPESKICIFNGPTKEIHYERFKSYWE